MEAILPDPEGFIQLRKVTLRGVFAGTVEDPFSPSSSGEGDMDQGQIQLTGTVMRLDRVPAELRSVGRDTFSVHVRAWCSITGMTKCLPEARRRTNLERAVPY